MNTGIVMDIEGRFTYVFTSDCQLIKVRKNNSHFVGQQITVSNRDRTAGDRLSQSFSRISAKGYALAAAAAVVVIIAAVLLATSPWQGNPAVTYMSVDINPSVELALDAEHRVVDTRPLNPEAKTLLEHVSLDGLLYNQAIEAWVRTVRDVMPEKLDQVMISVLLGQTDDKFKASLMEMNGYQSSGELTGLNVWVLYSSDFEIREQATENNLSIGRQLLLSESLQQDLDWTASTIREASLDSVLRSLLANGETKLLNQGNNGMVEATETTGAEMPYETEDEITPSSTEPQTTTTMSPTATTALPPEETSIKPSETPPPETTAKPTETTAKPPKVPAGPVPDPASYARDLVITSNDANGIALSWTPAPTGTSFRYCKIIMSEISPEPTFPYNGYLTYYKDPAVTSYLINNTKKYTANMEDININSSYRYMVPGKQYFIRIAYVYDDPTNTEDGFTVQYSNVQTAVYNGPEYVG
ncbi:MAG: anti-sigma factor domain-containing protein [Clostridiaceae bacterium]|nr:anti-sigma factor domain-containing protein [Clostridiaceae bacterium]